MKRQSDLANFEALQKSALENNTRQKSALKSATLRLVTLYFSALKASIFFTRESTNNAIECLLLHNRRTKLIEVIQTLSPGRPKCFQLINNHSDKSSEIHDFMKVVGGKK